MKIVLLALLLSGCGTLGALKGKSFKRGAVKKPRLIPLAEKKLRCIERLIRLDVKATDAADICSAVYSRK